MNCQEVISQMGFSCRKVSDNLLRIWSPFTYSDDGEHIGLFIEKINTGYRVTDNCEALMHASAKGIRLTESRLNSVRKIASFGASMSTGGELSAIVSETDIGTGMASVLNAALSVSHFESQWKPKGKNETFYKEVEDILENQFGNRLLKKVSVVGASGHQLELPFALQEKNFLTYIQPIPATEDSMIDWRRVYEGWGKMSDIKSAGIMDNNRLIILERAANNDDMGRAINLLASSASVLDSSKLNAWAKRRAA